VSVSALKGRRIPAQGATLGMRGPPIRRSEGTPQRVGLGRRPRIPNMRRSFRTPVDAVDGTQGVALGWYAVSRWDTRSRSCSPDHRHSSATSSNQVRSFRAPVSDFAKALWGTGGAAHTSRLVGRDGGRECPGASARHSTASPLRALSRSRLQPDPHCCPRLPVPLEFVGQSHRLPRQGLPSGHSLPGWGSSPPTGQPGRSARCRAGRGPAADMACAAAATSPGNPDSDRPSANGAPRPTAAPPGAADSRNVYKSSCPPYPLLSAGFVHLSSLSSSQPTTSTQGVEGWRGGGVEGWRGCDPIGIAASLARLDAQTQSPYHTPSPDDGGGDFEAPAPSSEGAVATPPSSEGIEQA
jgi:hypothetical protein